MSVLAVKMWCPWGRSHYLLFLPSPFLHRLTPGSFHLHKHCLRRANSHIPSFYLNLLPILYFFLTIPDIHRIIYIESYQNIYIHVYMCIYVCKYNLPQNVSYLTTYNMLSMLLLSFINHAFLWEIYLIFLNVVFA